MKRLRSVLGIAPVLFLAAAACSSEDAGNGQAPATKSPDEVSFELFASTRQLTDADLALVTNMTDDGVISFSSEPASLAGVDVGQVILGGMSKTTPAGLLRLVTDVDRSNGLVLHTTQAPLQVAFRKLHVKATRDADPNTSTTPFATRDVSPLTLQPQFTVATGKGDKTQNYEIVIFDGDGDTSTTNDQVKIDATLGGGYIYEIGIDIDWGAVDKLPDVVTNCLAAIKKVITGEKPTCNPGDLLPEAKTSFKASPFLTLDIEATGAASLEYEKDIDVGTIELPPFPLGPIVFTPKIDILAGIKGGASARFDVTAHGRADATTTVTMSSKHLGSPTIDGPKVTNVDVTADPPKIDLHAQAEVTIGARLNVPAYGTVGPYATIDGVARIEAAPLEDPCFKVTFGLETELGVRITTPRLPLLGYLTLADAGTGKVKLVDKEVASGKCELLPDPPLPPGGGPTPKVFQSPTFTTFAKELAGDVDGESVASQVSIDAASLLPSIDSRYLLGGSFARALHKVDGDGNVTWLGRLGAPDHPHRILASAPMKDGAILALAKPEDTTSFALAKLGQSGALAWSKTYTLPDTCTATVKGMIADPGHGYLVFGRCESSNSGFLVRVDEDGAVLRARTYVEPNMRLAYPTMATLTDGELVVVGEVAADGELEQPFVTRFDAEDHPTKSMSFVCPTQLTAEPSAVLPAEGGAVTVVGSANGLGLVARVKKDGTLGFVKYPNIGAGASDSLVITSVAELSTTGMIIGARARDVLGTALPWIVLAGLDSGGSTLWSKKYAIAEKPLGYPAMRLTDDGGIFVTLVGATQDGTSASAYAMKVFAKDGFLAEGQALTSEAQVLQDTTCETTSRSLAPTVTDVTVTVTDGGLQKL